MLGLLGLGAAGVVFGGTVERGVNAALRPLDQTGLLPSSGGFSIYTITAGYPAEPADYRLHVRGMVERPVALDVAALRALPATHLDDTFQCVTGWSVADVHWVGVSLVDLAAHVGLHPGAGAYRFSSFDGEYTESLTVEQAHQSGAIVAYSMLGGPVTREHGGPVRLYVPKMYGYKSIKWLSGIEAVTSAPLGYWEQNGYPVNAWIDGHPPTT